MVVFCLFGVLVFLFGFLFEGEEGGGEGGGKGGCHAGQTDDGGPTGRPNTIDYIG